MEAAAWQIRAAGQTKAAVPTCFFRDTVHWPSAVEAEILSQPNATLPGFAIGDKEGSLGIWPYAIIQTRALHTVTQEL